ncbi:MAG: beta-propeller domain-containing protein [Polyangiaceae bacterium]
MAAAPAPNVFTPVLGVTAPFAGSPFAEQLTAARLETGNCDDSRQAIELRAAPLIARMREEVDQAFQRWHDAQPECWEEFRQNAERWIWDAADGHGVGGSRLSGIGYGGGGRAVAAPGSAKSFSRTNTQLANVDEPDLVKTDGRYLYLGLNGALRIVEALKPNIVSVTKLAGNVRELFVERDRVVVFSSSGGNGSATCRYAYDCAFAGDGSSTQITVFDVTDRRAPKQVRQLELSGSLITSRRIGNTVHTVVSDGDPSNPPYESWMSDMPVCGVRESAVRARVKRLKERNEASIRAYVAQFAPTLSEGVVLRRLCEHVWKSRIDDGEAFTTLVSFDLERDATPAVTTTVRSRPGAVFASASALYLAVAHDKPRHSRQSYRPYGASTQEISEVHQFRIGDSPQQTRYLGSGVVPGHALNQFAMDEWYGYLRIATSTGRVPDPRVESTLSVLSPDSNGNLVRVGAVEHIAPHEDIRAVRFDGDRGYVVTFKKTDPLFVLDLSQPARPLLAGELKIPGFSTYLQRIDENHLISIGFDANDQGEFAYFDGLLLQMFDVQKPTQPKLLFREKIGTRGSASEAATDHLAFNYFGDRGLLAIPTTICEGGDVGRTGTTVSFSGLLVYRVDAQRGFAALGAVDHGLKGQHCGHWWSRSRSAVKRSVFVDDLVYSVATDRVKVQLLSKLGSDLADLKMRP